MSSVPASESNQQPRSITRDALTATSKQKSTAERNASGGLRDLELDQFLQLMITELQNQDPLDPMDNSQILEQIGQIRSIAASNQLQDTLASVLTGQNLSTASGMIGKEVQALSDDGQNVTGVVDKVSIEVDPDDNTDRTLKIHIGTRKFDIDKVREIVEKQADSE